MKKPEELGTLELYVEIRQQFRTLQAQGCDVSELFQLVNLLLCRTAPVNLTEKEIQLCLEILK